MRRGVTASAASSKQPQRVCRCVSVVEDVSQNSTPPVIQGSGLGVQNFVTQLLSPADAGEGHWEVPLGLFLDSF